MRFKFKNLKTALALLLTVALVIGVTGATYANNAQSAAPPGAADSGAGISFALPPYLQVIFHSNHSSISPEIVHIIGDIPQGTTLIGGFMPSNADFASLGFAVSGLSIVGWAFDRAGNEPFIPATSSIIGNGAGVLLFAQWGAPVAPEPELIVIPGPGPGPVAPGPGPDEEDEDEPYEYEEFGPPDLAVTPDLPVTPDLEPDVPPTQAPPAPDGGDDDIEDDESEELDEPGLPPMQGPPAPGGDGDEPGFPPMQGPPAPGGDDDDEPGFPLQGPPAPGGNDEDDEPMPPLPGPPAPALLNPQTGDEQGFWGLIASLVGLAVSAVAVTVLIIKRRK